MMCWRKTRKENVVPNSPGKCKKVPFKHAHYAYVPYDVFGKMPTQAVRPPTGR